MGTPRKPILHHLHDYFFPHPRNKYRPHIFSTASVLVLVFAVIVCEAGYLVQTKIVFQKTNFLASVLPGALVALTNQDRTASGIGNVSEDALLDKAAQAAAEDMAAKGYFAHVSPEGKTPWYWLDQVGYKYSYAGENLAVNFTDSSEVEVAWMNSPTHRANIEKAQYTKVGIGTANGMYEGVNTTFVVQFFATPETTVSPTVVAPPAEKPSPENLVLRPLSSTTSALAEATVLPAPAVLGTETLIPTNAAAREIVPVHSSSMFGWMVTVLTSPSHTLRTILTGLLMLVASLFAIALFFIRRMHHPRVLIGGVALLFVLLTVLLFNSYVFHPVKIATGSGAAITSL